MATEDDDDDDDEDDDEDDGGYKDCTDTILKKVNIERYSPVEFEYHYYKG